MAGLVLKLRAHEQILVNGVVMENGERSARLIVKTPNVNVLRLRDALSAEEVDTPVKRVCYIAQCAVAGEIDGEDAAAQIGSGIAQLRDALQDIEGSEHLDAAVRQLRERNFYGVLRKLRDLLPIEARLLGHVPANGAGDANGNGG